MISCRYIIAIIIFLSISCISSGQQQIRVMNYNVLNFPLGNIPDRQDSLRNIIDYIQPDLVLLQELRSEFGLNLILDESFNHSDNLYASSTYVPLQSNPNSSFPLQQAIIYNTEIFAFKDEAVILTSYRDINELVLYLHSDQLADGDTTFLYLYTTHLKSSEGASNEVIRNEMASSFVEHLEQLPANSYVMLGGDFNVYNSSESAYQTLLDSENNIPLYDPINSPGNWHSSAYPDKSILTQSTRSSQIFGDGAGGGIDDRFDFILLSEAFFQDSEVDYIEGSYKALGNNGTCYNSSILSCIPDNAVPSEIMTSLYYMSDHLPIILDLQLDITLSSAEDKTLGQFYNIVSANPIKDYVEIIFNSKEAVHFSISTTDGKIINNGTSSDPRLFIETQNFPNGLYLLNLKNGRYNKTIKLIKAD